MWVDAQIDQKILDGIQAGIYTFSKQEENIVTLKVYQREKEKDKMKYYEANNELPGRLKFKVN